MARKARLKAGDAIFHIVCKSITEVDLFRDCEDKNKYLSLLKKYKIIYNVKIYGYCLMDNHAHLLIDANGADISKVMHGINFSYAMYFNRKYKRQGPLFKDRFKSIIIDTDKYLKTVSLYIHNNPTDIGEFKNCPEEYAFSSLGIYTGKKRDAFGVVDYDFVMGFFGNNLKKARQNYCKSILGCTDKKWKEEIEFEDETTEYKSERKILLRNFKSDDIIEFIASKMGIAKIFLHMKYNRKLVKSRALIVVLMRGLCNFKSSDICRILGNITQARTSKLCTIGVDLIISEKKYENIIGEFIESYS
ncbi:MAG: transposase [Clostridiaceae bacterium]|nr:transposase [Clostridiaceae bacterium]